MSISNANLFDAEFNFGFTVDDQLTQALEDIIAQEKIYTDAITDLKTYFSTEGNLWVGKDAATLRDTVVAEGGPLKKLENCGAEITNLKDLAVKIQNAVEAAEAALQTNISTAMKGGEEK